MLRRCMAGAWGGAQGGAVGMDGQGTDRANQPTSQPTQYGAVAACLPRVIESVFLCLTSHFRDLRVGSRQREGSY